MFALADQAAAAIGETVAAGSPRAGRRPAAAEWQPSRVGDVPEIHRLTGRTACGYLLAMLAFAAGRPPAPMWDMSHAGRASVGDTEPDAALQPVDVPLDPNAQRDRTAGPAADPGNRGGHEAGVPRLADDKSIQVPKELGVAGWWEGGPRPGQVGPAVVLGHVSWNAPAVFSGSTRCRRATRFSSIGQTTPRSGSS